ncbi:MAG: MG2 domain-containing protein [Bacteroidota bacterium]
MIFIFSLAGLHVGAQTATNDDVLEKLKVFSATHATEKAYLQFDKPYYITGDTIYFKAYITLGDRYQLSALSRVLHVDLINPNNKIYKTIKLQLNSGLVWGDFALSDSLPAGNYRVRAYTNWMCNEGNTAFFEREILVTGIEKQGISQNAPIRNAISKPDIQFFPEGGSLVTGIRSKVAFKAIGTNGYGIGASAVIMDDENKEVGRFSSTHLGMGYFYLQPQPGKNYTAKLTYADGTQTNVKLPAAEISGVLLSVNNDSLPKATVRIEANKVLFAQNRDKDYTLLIYSGGVPTSVKCKLDTNIITLDIVKRRLHTGVATVTLFSPAGEPLCERLFFVQNYDQLKIGVNSDKPAYQTRGKVSLNINVKNRADSTVIGYFSVSVVDERKIAVNTNDEHTILTDLLLTSDLKGRVEQSNYYFTNLSDEARGNLDLVMLTHGYRRFEWKQVLSGNNTPPVYQAEKGLEIAGTATSLGGRPLAKAVVSLIASSGSGQVLTETTDAKGNFKFANLLYQDTAKFILQAVNAGGSNNTRLTYTPEKPPVVEQLAYRTTIPEDTGAAIKAYIKNSVKQREQLYAEGKITGKMLKEVKVNGRKLDKPIINSRYGVADHVINGKDIRFGGSLTDQLEYKIPGVVFNKSGIGNDAIAMKSISKALRPVPMRVIVDGFEMQPNFSINSISTGLIDKIEIMTNATVHDLETDGAIIITLKHGYSADEIQSKGILPITAIGFYKAREFYSPKYESPDTGKTADFRTTIYWNPEVATDKDGNASLTYYNADGTGSYKVVIEGIDNKGNLGRQVYHYTVE